MCGMARQFGEPQPLMSEILAAAAKTGMPVDVRPWRQMPPAAELWAPTVGSARGAK